MKPFIKLLFSCIILVFLTCCKHSQTDIDTSNVNINPINIKRLDADVFSITAQNSKEKTIQFQKKYGAFYNRYMNSILNNGGVYDSLYKDNLLRFVNDKDMKKAYSEIRTTYSDNDVELLADDFTEAVKRFKIFFKNRKTPSQIVTYMSGFNYNIIYADSTLAIGLDMYLGSNNQFYNMLQFPKFKTHTMSKEHIVSDAIRGWIITEFDNAEPESKLVSHMIFYGKIFYTTKALLPLTNDSLIFGYTSQQMKYCNNYEKNLWGFFAKDDKLFANDMKIVTEYTNDGPFTGSISKECPPRIAMWLGYNIVKSYMEHNENVTLNDLMNEKDFQKILSKSKYKP